MHEPQLDQPWRLDGSHPCSQIYYRLGRALPALVPGPALKQLPVMTVRVDTRPVHACNGQRVAWDRERHRLEVRLDPKEPAQARAAGGRHPAPEGTDAMLMPPLNV